MDSCSNNGSNKKVKMFFFPFIAGGHLFPMIGVARFFASHPEVEATIIATPKNVQLFQNAIDCDREAGHDIAFHTIELPNKGELGGVENFLGSVTYEVRMKLFMSIMKLKDTLRDLLRAHSPDCLVSDPMHPWSVDVAKEVGVPRVVFHSSSLFTLCAEHSLLTFKPHERVGSDTEPFVLQGLPHKVEFTRLKIPQWHRSKDHFTALFQAMRTADDQSYGVIVNSFEGAESQYHDYSRNVMGKKVWVVGPVTTSQNAKEENAQDEEKILNWLHSNESNSVLYVSFGTEARTHKDQFHEIAHGLESSGHPFIWVARTNTYESQGDEGWFPEGFEERIKKSNQGLIIKAWAPQVMILGHPNVGAFMTHCGWNSCLEGVTKEVPMITWPLTVDQFYNESLLVDVLKVGIRVGNGEDVTMEADAKATVTRDQVEEAVKHMMGGGTEIEEMRKRLKHYAHKSKTAVQQHGPSFRDVDALVQDLKARWKGTETSSA